MLRTQAGVGILTALCLIHTLGEVARFSSSSQVVAFAGLCPLEKSSEPGKLRRDQPCGVAAAALHARAGGERGGPEGRTAEGVLPETRQKENQAGGENGRHQKASCQTLGHAAGEHHRTGV
ncbi:MAG: transposase [Acidobacteria bacterium]|nr:transposase [Acidobacteriota bacterium]